jgi:glycosyltransferase involved in cell wall biosynthesis
MHQGLPIIVSDIPEQRETVADEDTGEVGALLPPLGEVEAWTKALDSLAADPGLRTRLSATAQAIVIRKFTLTRMIDGFEAVLAPSGEDG